MSEWTVYITNDNCPDYTWGLTEERTRQSFADIVAAHLDLMTRTDAEAPENQDRYNMAVTQEALCFVERYPGRKEELIRRIKEGRVFVSPYLCNTLWAFQSFEGAIRSFYPARRLEREWGIPMTVAEHIEEPSLPWGMASLLAGCGLRWLSNPFYSYDSTFGNLENPPLFLFEGPDGGRVRVVMDPWACHRAHYGQGAWLLADPGRIAGEWVEHYRQFAPAYPLRHALASGTHDDISPRSGEQAPGFAEAIKRYNESPQPHPRLVNAALPQFCEAVDAAEARHPFLPVVRGCFGHSWDVWPVSLAKHAADMRANDRDFLAAEALLAVASLGRPDLREATQADRERAEWLWAMLGDHAWNGTDDQNKRHNADLRRRWNEELAQINRRLVGRGWEALGLAANEQALTLFNSLSFPRQGLVCVEARPGLGGAADGARHVPAQVVREDDSDLLCFISPPVEGFGLRPLRLTATPPAAPGAPRLRASPTELESPLLPYIYTSSSSFHL